MNSNFLGETRLLSNIRTDLLLISRRDCEKHYYYTKIVAMTLVLFRSRIIVRPTIMGEGTDVMNQVVMRAAAKLLLCIQSIILYNEL